MAKVLVDIPDELIESNGSGYSVNGRPAREDYIEFLRQRAARKLTLDLDPLFNGLVRYTADRLNLTAEQLAEYALTEVVDAYSVLTDDEVHELLTAIDPVTSPVKVWNKEAAAEHIRAILKRKKG
jgi:hypothetical protein